MRYLKRFESHQNNSEMGYTLKFKISFRLPDDYDGGDTYFPDEDDLSNALEYSGSLDTSNDYQVEYIIKKDGEAIFVVTCTNEETDEYFPDEYNIDYALEDAIDSWNSYDIEVLDDPIYNIYKLLNDESDIELFDYYDIIRDNGKSVVLDRLNIFLKDIGKNPVNFIEGYKNI